MYTIPDTVTTISDDAFTRAAHLKTVTFPEDGLTTIGEYAFYGAGLETVTIGTGVTTIGQEAFNECFDLKLLTINTTTPPLLGGFAFKEVSGSFSIEVPGDEVIYREAEGWENYGSFIFSQERNTD